MLIAGGVYVERCATPETVQLLGSAGRAAFALSGLRSGLTLHTFHPPELWPDLRANFVPLGIACEPHPSHERITFSYLFPLGRPVQTPAYAHPAGDRVVEGRDVLSFGCVEGRFVVRGEAVVQDPQGSLGPGFRKGGGTASRLAIVLNAQEALAQTGRGSIGEAAAALLAEEDATVVTVKDGPRGAMTYDAAQGERRVPAYGSSSLYKIGSGDVFSAAFAHWWLDGVDPAEAADRASRQTAAYVECPVLPLSAPDGARPSRRGLASSTVTLVVPTGTLTGRWFATIVAEALRHLGIPAVEVLDRDLWMATAAPPPVRSAALVCLDDAEASQAAGRLAAGHFERHVILLDSDRPAGKVRARNVFTDLSQAIYELCWVPV